MTDATKQSAAHRRLAASNAKQRQLNILARAYARKWGTPADVKAWDAATQAYGYIHAVVFRLYPGRQNATNAADALHKAVLAWSAKVKTLG